MKVIYIFSVLTHGNGGHIYSVKHITTELKKDVDLHIISIGKKPAKAFDDDDKYEHLNYNGINFLKFSKKLKNRLATINPQIIHCFDVMSYITIKSITKIENIDVILTKCGGPNPKRFPDISNLIVFSKENFRWFATNPKYATTRLCLIPNRVKEIVIDPQTNSILKPKDFFSFVRIARIGKTYKESLFTSLKLVEYLISEGYKVCLFIIGTIENQSVYEELKAAGSDNVIFLTEDVYTVNASRMLYLGDAVIATGRGFMEAASLGKPVLSFAENSEYPILINSENFHLFFETNFSGRNSINVQKPNKNLNEIKQLIVDREFYHSLTNFSRSIFRQYFDVASANHKYLEFYEQITKDKNKLLLSVDYFHKVKIWAAFLVFSFK